MEDKPQTPQKCLGFFYVVKEAFNKSLMPTIPNFSLIKEAWVIWINSWI